MGRDALRRFVCIDDGVPEATPRLLAQACEARGVAFHSFDPRGYDPLEAKPLGMGDLLYRPAVSPAAIRAEHHLYSAEAATFYADPAGPFFPYVNVLLMFERAGLPVPRAVPVLSADRAWLRAALEVVGGLPVVVKLLGWSGGVGTIRADSLPTLHSLLDLLLMQGNTPHLMRYVPDAVHWRVVVVGQRAVAAYRNRTMDDDFRTAGTCDPADFTADPPRAIAGLAERAVAAQRLEFGGVDILAEPGGALALLEANFPCYFPHAQEVAGIDIAGAMLDHLLAKADAKVRG